MSKVALEPGIPKKVLRKAHQLGVHNDCIVSGKPCAACSDSIGLAFDFFYAHCENEQELMTAIIEDFRSDLEDDIGP